MSVDGGQIEVLRENDARSLWAREKAPRLWEKCRVHNAKVTLDWPSNRACLAWILDVRGRESGEQKRQEMVQRCRRPESRSYGAVWGMRRRCAIEVRKRAGLEVRSSE